MATKMTDEQKAAKKEASKERQQAFNARKKAYDRELEIARQAAAKLPEHAAMLAAQAASDEAMEQRDAELKDIDSQIAKLREQRKEAEARHRLVLEAATAKRHATWDANSASIAKHEQAVQDRYPDIVGCWSFTAWDPKKVPQ